MRYRLFWTRLRYWPCIFLGTWKFWRLPKVRWWKHYKPVRAIQGHSEIFLWRKVHQRLINVYIDCKNQWKTKDLHAGTLFWILFILFCKKEKYFVFLNFYFDMFLMANVFFIFYARWIVSKLREVKLKK